MSLRIAEFPSLRDRIAHQFSWRRIARYHLGLELLRCWKQAVQCVELLEIPRRVESINRFALHHELHRKARRLGGHDALMTLVLVTAAGASIIPWRNIATPARRKPTQAAAPAGPFTEKLVAQNEMALARPAFSAAPSIPLPETDGAATRLKREYAFARERCLARLRETDSFQRLATETDALQIQVEALRRDDPRSQLPDTSLRWMRSKSQLNGMIQAALKVDPDVQKAESAMRAGGLIQPTFPIRSPEQNEPDPSANQAAAGL